MFLRLDQIKLHTARPEGPRVRVRTRASAGLVIFGAILAGAGAALCGLGDDLLHMNSDTPGPLLFGAAAIGSGASHGLLGLAFAGTGLSPYVAELEDDEVEPAPPAGGDALRRRR